MIENIEKKKLEVLVALGEIWILILIILKLDIVFDTRKKNTE